MISDTKLRAYFFSNMYISQIQHGIQAAHVIAEISQRFPSDLKFRLWANDHKTIIILNAGYQSELEKCYDMISKCETLSSYPHAFFREEERALNGAMTSVGIILPDFIYDFDLDDPMSYDDLASDIGYDVDKVVDFVRFMKSKRLA